MRIICVCLIPKVVNVSENYKELSNISYEIFKNENEKIIKVRQEITYSQ